jgi:hypothetical protein
MMKYWILSCLILCVFISQAQELYVFSEPASIMPAKSMGLKLSSRFADRPTSGIGVRIMPEWRVGINKKWMTHLSAPLSNFYEDRMRWDAIRLYTQYRFLSNDALHSHFRMAAFAEGAYSRNPYRYDEINLEGDQSGWQLGLIATRLMHRLAISGTAGVVKSYYPAGDIHSVHAEHSTWALNYNLAAGYLLLPRQYTSYRQTNLNLYVELMGQQGLEQSDYMIDLAPAVQLIFNSATKVNLGARFQVGGNMSRVANQNYFISLEHSLLKAF